MAHEAVMSAVRTRMGAEWTHTPVKFPNGEGQAPEDGSSYVLVQYPASTTTTPDIATHQAREVGGIRFVIHTPAGSGTNEANFYASELRRIFRYETFEGVKTEEPSSPFYDDSNDVGPYSLATVVVPYSFDYEPNGD
jgi:hypothetical protein